MKVSIVKSGKLYYFKHLASSYFIRMPDAWHKKHYYNVRLRELFFGLLIF